MIASIAAGSMINWAVSFNLTNNYDYVSALRFSANSSFIVHTLNYGLSLPYYIIILHDDGSLYRIFDENNAPGNIKHNGIFINSADVVFVCL